MKLLAIVFFAATAIAVSNGEFLDDCLQQDSISCVQKTIYRKAKEFFETDNVELVSGVSLVKNAETSSRSAKTGKELLYDQEIDSAANVAERQNVIENFVSDEASDFFRGRSIKVNLGSALEKVSGAARALSESVPQEIRTAVDEAVEGRGKKKIMQKLLPLLLAAKVKFGALLSLAYFGIALLAKKAIFASVISIVISGFFLLKSLWTKGGGHHDVTAYNGGWNNGASAGWSAPVASGGWSSSGSAGWEDNHGYAQSQAYSGYHH